jgi:hypothetical protein
VRRFRALDGGIPGAAAVSDDAVRELARAAGIAVEWTDAAGAPHRVAARPGHADPLSAESAITPTAAPAPDPSALRFSFVRNPYARLVSLWAHQFRNRPLIPGLSSMNSYLACRERVDPSLPKGADRTISFPDFVTFVTSTAIDRIDAHWTHQTVITDMPGITLDFVGKVETFANDFSRVLDHIAATPGLRVQSLLPFNTSDHDAWPSYYSAGLANTVYRAFELDFDRFQYPRSLPH